MRNDSLILVILHSSRTRWLTYHVRDVFARPYHCQPTMPLPLLPYIYAPSHIRPVWLRMLISNKFGRLSSDGHKYTAHSGPISQNHHVGSLNGILFQIVSLSRVPALSCETDFSILYLGPDTYGYGYRHRHPRTNESPREEIALDVAVWKPFRACEWSISASLSE